MGESYSRFLSAPGKIIVVFILSSLLTAVLVTSYTYNKLITAGIKDWIEHQKVLAVALAQHYDNEIYKAQTDLEFLAKVPIFSDFPYMSTIDFAINGIPEEVEVEKRKLMNEFMSKNDRFSVLFILMPNGEHYLAQPFDVQRTLQRHNFFDRPYFQEVLKTKKTVISDSFFAAVGALGITIDVPILDSNGTIKAHLGGFFHLDKWSQLVDKTRIGSFRSGFLVDRNKYLIAHTDMDLLQEGIRGRFTRHPLLLGLSRINEVSTPMIDRTDVTTLVYQDPFNRQESVGTLVPLRSGWGFALTSKVEEIRSLIYPQVWRASAFTALMLFFVSGLGVAGAYWIGKRWSAAEQALHKAHDELELRVKERTAALHATNEQLRKSEKKMRQQNEYLAALHETTLTLMNRLDLSDLLEAIVVRSAILLGTSHGFIYQVEQGSDETVLRVGLGLFNSHIGYRLKFGEGAVGKAWQTGQPAVIEKYQTWPDRSLEFAQEPIQNVVAIPLKSDQQILGIFGLASVREDQKFTEEEVLVLNRFAELASIALDNVRLYTSSQQELTERKKAEKELRQQNEYLAALHQTTLALMNRLDIADLLEAIIARAGTLLETPHGFIFLVESEGLFPSEYPVQAGEPELALQVGVGVYSKWIGYRLRSGEGIAGTVWQTGQPMVVDDYSTWSGRVPAFSNDPHRSVIAAPLKSGPKTVGVIGLGYVEKDRLFGDKEIMLLGRFAELASIALDNARLYTSAQQELIERRRAEEALREKNEELGKTLQQLKEMQNQLVTQEKLASLGALTAGIAHEIKNPLNFVNNFAKLSISLTAQLRENFLQQKDRLESRALTTVEEVLSTLEQNVKRIHEHGRRANNIIQRMQMHSRRKPGERHPIDIHALLTEYATLAYRGIRTKDPSFNAIIQTDFNPSIGLIKVIPQDLSRVFLNIVDNACYAMYEKKKELGDEFSPTLWLKTQDLDNHIEIRIRDNGKGIPKEVVDKIFDPFFTTKPTGQGTGLGLSISYDVIVQEHKGELRLETEEGKYTEFIIVLPKN